MDQLQKQLAALSANVDNFPVGAANVHDSVSQESEINTVLSKIQCTNADVLRLQALIEVAKNLNANRGKTDNTHIAKYENALVDDASTINHQRNMAVIAGEAVALWEALKMRPEEMEHQPLSCSTLLERIRNIVPKCSSSQLELLKIQEDIEQKLREIQVMECALMKKKSNFAKELVKQKKQLNEKKSSKDEGYDRKSKSVKIIASQVNKLKLIIQGLIHISPEVLADNETMIDILAFTRKPINLETYSTQL